MRMNFIIGSICIGLLFGLLKDGSVLPSEKIFSGLLFAACFGLAACVLDALNQGFGELSEENGNVDRSYSDEKNRL